jgi:shikimate kinase
MHDLILLVGYRGVGKTTIGRQLAKSLEYDFLDTDEEIVRRKKMQIAEIVATKGWQEFRQYECEVLLNVRDRRATVVATGGGAIAHQQEWLELRRRGVVFWLTAAAHVLQERLHHDHVSPDTRPSLTGAGLEEEIVTVLRERNPLYKQVAHHCIDTSQKQIQEIVSEILAVLNVPLVTKEY